MRKTIFIIFVLGFLLLGFGIAFAEQTPERVEINFFFSHTCPHCAKEKVFLNQLEEKYPELDIKRHGVDQTQNIEKLKQFYEEYNVPRNEWGLVPATFSKENYFLGFNQALAQEIEACVEECIGGAGGGERARKRLSLPIIGEIDPAKFPPLALAVILGGLDGFNACAMLALGFLLAILVATGLRKKVFLIGGVFIFVSGLVYFLFISAWLNLFLVLANIKLITWLAGGLIILFALFLLKDYVHGVVCKLCRVGERKENIFVKFEKKLFEKIKGLSTAQMSLPLTLLAVAGVAAGVNMIELVCSFGFPLAFTKVLTSLQLPTSSYYFYLLVYIIFYILDDFIIFCLAIWTLKISQVSQKYLKAVKLISAIVLLLLGLIMLIRPEILSFG